jgi:glutamyl-tRNA reductase
MAGINHETASIDVREKISLRADQVPEAFQKLRTNGSIKESMIVSTCNRIELFILSESGEQTLIKDLMHVVLDTTVRFDELMYFKEGGDAVMHACRVASGLDSLVMGEPQILGQMKDAYNLAQHCGAAGHGMQQVFSQVFAVAKKVRSKTGIGENNLSVSYAAIKMAEKFLGGFSSKTAMIIGAGEMGELTVRNLVSHGISTLYVTNRTFQRAVELAERFKGIPIMFHEIFDYAIKSDIIISSIVSDGFIMNKGLITEIVKKREGRDLFIFDISLPRSIEPGAMEIEHVHLYNIDDLQHTVDSNMELRKKETEKAVRIIEEKVPDILRTLSSFDVIPIIASIRRYADAAQKETEQKLLAIDGIQRELVTELTGSLVGRILHFTTEQLRDYAHSVNNKR